MVDKQYEDQYPTLFPEKYNVSNVTCVNNDNEIHCPYDLLLKIDNLYKEILKVDGDIPSLDTIYEYCTEWVKDKAEEYAENLYENDIRYWEDDDFRELAIQDAEDILCSVNGYEIYEQYIENAMHILDYTYINYNGNIDNDAQLNIFDIIPKR